RHDRDHGASSEPSEVQHERIEDIGHVRIAQGPRRDVVAEHRAVVFLSVLDDTGVLLRIEELILGDDSVVPQQDIPLALHLEELAHRFPLTTLGESEWSHQTALLPVVTSVTERGLP